MDMGYGIMGKKVMKELILMIREMGKGFIHGVEEVIIRGNLWKIWGMGLEKCIGIKIRFIEDNGKKVINKEKGKYGKTERKLQMAFSNKAN